MLLLRNEAAQALGNAFTSTGRLADHRKLSNAAILRLERHEKRTGLEKLSNLGNFMRAICSEISHPSLIR
jgi:hypothetical protein